MIFEGSVSGLQFEIAKDNVLFSFDSQDFLSPNNYFIYTYVFHALNYICDLANYFFLPIKIVLLHNLPFF